MPHQRRTGEPRIHQDWKLTGWLLEIGRRREFLEWRKGEEKGGITIYMLNIERHDVAQGRWTGTDNEGEGECDSDGIRQSALAVRFKWPMFLPSHHWSTLFLESRTWMEEEALRHNVKRWRRWRRWWWWWRWRWREDQGQDEKDDDGDDGDGEGPTVGIIRTLSFSLREKKHGLWLMAYGLFYVPFITLSRVCILEARGEEFGNRK